MMGDYHVRFCERLGVKLPLATRHSNRRNEPIDNKPPPATRSL